jgi:hypothetical protein
MTIIIGTLGFVIAFWLLTMKIGVLRVLGYELWIDIVISIAIIVVLTGTTSGSIIALLGGAIVSLSLSIAKAAFGFERFDFATREWRYTGPKWTRFAKKAVEEAVILAKKLD